MVFGKEVAMPSSLSVIEEAFPDARTLLWVPKKTRHSEVNRERAADDVVLVVTQEVLLAASRHVSQTLERELGGFLLGNRYRCATGRTYVIIDQLVEAERTESDDVSLSFTHESLRRLEDHLDKKFRGKALLGWYHSHPRMNVFLSSDDLTVHDAHFGKPWHSALVIEPEKHFGGFFCPRGGNLDQHTPVEFYELLSDETRQTVVAWENYTGVDPIRNVTPPLARLNTRTVSSPAPVGTPTRPPSRQSRQALIALAAVSVLSFSTWQIYQRVMVHETPPPPPTPAPVQTPTEPVTAPPVPPVQEAQTVPTLDTRPGPPNGGQNATPVETTTQPQRGNSNATPRRPPRITIAPKPPVNPPAPPKPPPTPAPTPVDSNGAGFKRVEKPGEKLR
jgi:proteasome lid subunit RPN8/RPN11